MNRSILLIPALLAALLSACSVPEPQTVPDEGRSFELTALQEESPGSRTVIAEQTQVYWESGDAVKLFFDGNGSRFTTVLDAPAAVARFTGTLDLLIGFDEGFSAQKPLWGLYPWREDATSDNASVTTTLPERQVGRAGSFAPETFLTLGRSDNLTMSFYAVCGGVRFSLTQAGIRSVSLEGLGAEPLAGRIRIGFQDGVPCVEEVLEAQSVVTLEAPDKEGFIPGEWYYLVTLPGALDHGFRMTFHKGSRSAEWVRSAPVTIKRRIFGSLKDVDEGLVFQIPGVGDPDDPIPFADEKIKARLVAAFDTNADGELSYDEADQVTSLSGVFSGQTDYTSFDEFRFFTQVRVIPSTMCRNWSSLSSIQLPESIDSIGSHAFYGCSSLKGIVLPEALTRIERYTFFNCNALDEIQLPDGLEAIGDWAFSGSGLGAAAIPASVQTIGSCAFRNCASLSEVSLPSGLTELSSSVFQSCKALAAIQLPPGLEIIGSAAFSGCSALQEVIIPAGVTAIGGGAFYGCSALQAIRVLCATPPTGGSGMFTDTNGCPIYVPGATAYLYSTATYWKDYLNRLRSDDGSSVYYTSSDYSRDGEVVQLQQATVGRGVNLILLGDGFVDRDMEPGGKYEQRMRSAMEALFAYEPYRSERERFNVYTVKIVSANDQYHSSEANRRLTYDTDGAINFRSAICTEYGNKVPNPTGQPLKMAALCNSSTSVGRSYCIRNSTGWACCIVYDPNTNVLVHELCGHGFASLADEYSENGQAFTDRDGLDREWSSYGWNYNVDWRSDPATVRWAHFFSDSRYAGEGLGVFEGGKTYASGIYRPSYNSMMRYNNCPFNAPSREQIYKSIMRWSVGSSWQYDYETFVAADAPGREQAAGRLRIAGASVQQEEARLQEAYAQQHVPPVWIEDEETETSIPLEGKPVVKLLRSGGDPR